MTTVLNGSSGDRPTRRVRFDDFSGERLTPGRFEISGHSGRRAVILGTLVLMGLSGALALVFRDWRVHYRERAAFGAKQVATAIDPLAMTIPPEVSGAAWREAVAEAHAMLVTLTASNMLDLPQMQRLRDEIATRVERSRPETARAELASLWDDLAGRAGPNLVKRHPRPGLLSRPAR